MQACLTTASCSVANQSILAQFFKQISQLQALESKLENNSWLCSLPAMQYYTQGGDTHICCVHQSSFVVKI